MTAVRRLGRLPARHDMHMRLPHLSAIAPVLPPAPARCTTTVEAVSSWILGENDQVGDCTCVGPANAILAWTTMAGAPKRLTDDTIVGFYASLSGYHPGDESSDTGCIVEDVLSAWRTRGIGGDILSGAALLELRDHERVRQAIAHLGPVDLGVSLPTGWEQATSWDVSTAGEGGAGGHCVTAVAYTEAGPLIVSWGQLFGMTWAGWDAYVDEAHALLSRDAAPAADAVDWGKLQAALASVGETA